MHAPARPLVCIGHSHTENVAHAASIGGVALDVLNFWHLPDPFVHEHGRMRLAPALRARLIAPVFSLIGGAVHQDVGLVKHPRPFDFVWPGNADLPLDAAAEIIPFDAVHAAILARTQHFRDIMAAVREATDGPVFHMESPPTYEREELPANDPGFYYLFGQDAAFSPAALRFKLWRVHSAIIADHCRAIGIGFFAHPPASVNERGFMREALHGTPAHANAAYGALVLAQMQQAAAACAKMEPPQAEAPLAEAPQPERSVQPAEAGANRGADLHPEADGTVEGWVDSCRDGVVHGWAWWTGQPERKAVVEIVVDGVIVGEGLAANRRADLGELGKGEGLCGFAVALDQDFRSRWTGRPVQAQARVRGGGPIPNGSLRLDGSALGDLSIPVPTLSDVWPPTPWLLQRGGLTGAIDDFGPEQIDGWAQHLARKSARTEIGLWEAGTRIGTLVADCWRKDLEELRQGDGRWGFRVPVPDALRDGRLHSLELRLADGSPALAGLVHVKLPPPTVAAAHTGLVASIEEPGGRRRPDRTADASGAGTVFSIVVNFYNMRREAERTLTSLTRAYQRGIGGLRYEVLCIDNFSDPPLDAAWIESFGPEFRLLRPSRRLASPCAAINEAAAQAAGGHIAVMIDGAHLLTPGLLREAWDAVTEAPEAVVAPRHWFVGGDQRWLATVGYTREQEDMLFDKIAWPADGYQLFSVGGPYWESPKPWFDAMIESNCLFVPAALYRQIGGMDEQFSEPGAGLANLDLFRRASDASTEPVVSIIGEATFHQFHEGTTTNVTIAVKESRVRDYENRYVQIRGKPYPVTPPANIRLRGQVHTAQAVAGWQRPSSPAQIGVTDRIRPGPVSMHFDQMSQLYAQSAYVEAGLHERATWLGQRLGMAPSDALTIKDIVFRQRPERIVAVNLEPGAILLLSDAVALSNLPAARIVAVGESPKHLPDSVRPVVGDPAAPDTLSAVARALDTAERVLVLFAPSPGDLMPLDALRAYAGFVSYRSYLVFVGTSLGQPWLGYSTHRYVKAIQMLLRERPFAIDQECNPHFITTSPMGYLQRIEPFTGPRRTVNADRALAED